MAKQNGKNQGKPNILVMWGRGTAVNNDSTKSARNMFFYADDDSLLVGIRIGDYKYVFAEQRAPGTMELWAEPFKVLRLQKIYNLLQSRTSVQISLPTPTGIGT